MNDAFKKTSLGAFQNCLPLRVLRVWSKRLLIALIVVLGTLCYASDDLTKSRNQSVVDVEKLRLDVRGFRLAGLTVRTPESFAPQLQPFVGPEKRFQDLLDAASAVRNALRDEGLFLCDVYIPPQTISASVVELQVLEGKWGRILIEDADKLGITIETLEPYLEGLSRGSLATVYGVERAIALIQGHVGEHIRLTSLVAHSRSVAEERDLTLKFFADGESKSDKPRPLGRGTRPVIRRWNFPVGAPAIDDFSSAYGLDSCDGALIGNRIVCTKP